MPEAAEVRRITDKLRDYFKDRFLLSIDWLPKTKYTPHFEQTWPIVKHLFPTKCLDILCKGKQIFFFLENGLAFISGLGMEGHFYRFKLDQEERNNYLLNKNYRKFSLHFGLQSEISDSEAYYDDMLSYGNFNICNWNDAFTKMKELGPDLLAATTPINDIHSKVKEMLPSEFFEIATLEKFVTEIRRPRRTQMLICVFLLTHQEYFSGLGNYLVTEILYRSRIHPNRKLGSINDQEIVLLFSNCLITVQEAYICGGLTHGTFLDPDMNKGTFQVYVYKRENQYDPFGFLIKRIKVATGRSCYIVEEIQKLS
jgi:formamidopyrimidine-DNA glycosylase